MRTIKLTNEQIELICQALGIAETQFTNIHKMIVDNTVNVRKNYGSRREQSNKALYYHELASKMADLNIDINKGELDV